MTWATWLLAVGLFLMFIWNCALEADVEDHDKRLDKLEDDERRS